MVEFVMMSVLLVVLLFSVLQMAMFVYARNIVGASAAEGARYAANEGIDVAAGADRASSSIRAGLTAAAARRIPCEAAAARDGGSGLVVARVRCRGQLRMTLLPLRIPLWIDVTSSASKEGQP